MIKILNNKFIFIILTIIIIPGCTYHKAIDIQNERMNLINTQFSVEEKNKINNENERVILLAELKSLTQEVERLELEIKEIQKLNRESQAANVKKSEEDFNKKLSILLNLKSSLEKSIHEKKELIKVYTY
ncbi:hypothetical protein CS022_13625 [Veronia nyctiphanis]|uniref:Uncharacterized protein n=1 Tax=Veronia nyctiphanis TaxID=1278244 RepID=A0A4Q0YPI4_9GAMM|nr:hypothetical protein [Veronia nyctiphanis]RXJ72882.1 hypothetical protein CS022_13625 [Veronia nyctiphanis]